MKEEFIKNVFSWEEKLKKKKRERAQRFFFQKKVPKYIIIQQLLKQRGQKRVQNPQKQTSKGYDLAKNVYLSYYPWKIKIKMPFSIIRKLVRH